MHTVRRITPHLNKTPLRERRPGKFLPVFLGLATLGLIAPSAHAQNLVKNPGFETGDYTDYTVSGPVPIDGDAHTGNFAAAFNGVEAFGDLSQLITTTPGQTYDVSFYLNNDAGPANEFKASFAGFQGVDVVNADAFDYTQFTFSAVATSTSSVLDFDAFQDPGRFRLDDISVTPAAVPEASPAVSFGLLLALGLGGLAIAAKKKKASTTV